MLWNNLLFLIKIKSLSNGELLKEDKDGNLYYEDGAVFFDSKTVPDGQIGLIIRSFV